jgi:hypothetical protein
MMISITLWKKYCCPPHSTDEETEA